MLLSSLGDFAAEGIDGNFGILDNCIRKWSKDTNRYFYWKWKEEKEVMNEFKRIKLN
jgi:hypothetical protein